MSVELSGRGRLKIFLSYAPGAGKTFAMLDEAQRRKRRGQDVVIGSVDSRGRQSTIEELNGLEVIPITDGGVIDVGAILERKPFVALIDDLHTKNPAGSKNEKRWQDVMEILDGGVNVLTTVNVYQLESLGSRVFDITGLTVDEPLPDQILHSADEVELIDATPRALINRFERGEIFPDGNAGDRAKLYDEGILAALREMALREIAGRVDEDVLEARKKDHIEKPWATHDKVMICITSSRRQFRLIRRGFRVSQRLHGDIVAVHVEDKPHTPQEEQIVREDFALAERLGIPTVRLKGPAAQTIIQYAKDHNITELIIGHSNKTKLQELTRGSIVSDLARELKAVDILIVAVDEPVSADH
jgi:two-component system sensor histidine kinase KdpD